MTYIALFLDSKNIVFECIFHATNDAEALVIAEQMNLQSKCSLSSVMRTETLAIYPTSPEPDSNGFAKGVCYYYYQQGTIKDLVIFAVLDPKFVSALNPIIKIEPFPTSLIGKISTNEGNNVTVFSRAKYNYRHPNQ